MQERTKNILYLFQERQEDEAERDEAALRTRISADDGGDASNILPLPSADGLNHPS